MQKVTPIVDTKFNRINFQLRDLTPRETLNEISDWTQFMF
jgi:hypothetical protein